MSNAFFNRAATTVLLFLAGCAPCARAQQADKTALRALVPPPRRTLLHSMSLSVGMGYFGVPGYGFYWEGRRYTADIARVERQLRYAPAAHRTLLYWQLSELYQAQGDQDQAQQAAKTSMSLYARLLAQDPGKSRKGRLLAEYALALRQAGQTTEAERQANAAVRLAPRSWQTWAAVGQLLMRRAQANRSASDAGQPPAISSQAAWNEARYDFDTAVRLAPDLPQPYELRGGFRRAFASAARPSLTNGLAGLPDFERAVRLRPHDPYALAALAWMEYTDYGLHYFHGQGYDNFAVWKVLPPAKRRRVLGLRHSIERLTAGHDTLLRARAYTALAWLEYEFHDVAASQAQAHLRHALTLQPDLSDAEQMLMHTYGIEEQWQALAQFCAFRGQRHSAVRYCLIAAYADYKAHQWTQAEAQTRAAVTLKPDDPAANLFLAFLLLRSDAPEKWKEAQQCLEATDARLMTQSHLTPDVQQTQEESAVLQGFCHALLDRPDEARRQFTQALKTDKTNSEAQQALALLPPSQTPLP